MAKMLLDSRDWRLSWSGERELYFSFFLSLALPPSLSLRAASFRGRNTFYHCVRTIRTHQIWPKNESCRQDKKSFPSSPQTDSHTPFPSLQNQNHRLPLWHTRGKLPKNSALSCIYRLAFTAIDITRTDQNVSIKSGGGRFCCDYGKTKMWGVCCLCVRVVRSWVITAIHNKIDQFVRMMLSYRGTFLFP